MKIRRLGPVTVHAASHGHRNWVHWHAVAAVTVTPPSALAAEPSAQPSAAPPAGQEPPAAPVPAQEVSAPPKSPRPPRPPKPPEASGGK